MENNLVGKVAMQVDGHKRARFNLAHDVNTTCTFGETQPLLCRSLMPGAKAVLDIESLCRLAPMPAPTFGRVKLKTWTQFVEIRDLMRHFDAMLSETVVSEASTSFSPSAVPHMMLGALSAHILAGARCTLWYTASAGGDQRVSTLASYNVGDHSQQADWEALFNSLCDSHYIATSTAWPAWGGMNGASINAERLFDFGDGTSCHIPLDSQGVLDWFLGDYVDGSASDTNWYSKGAVSVEGADYLHTVQRTDGSAVTFAFRLSSFGKRLRKIFLGCGYQIDFRSKMQVSLLPLFAYYKAYFDLFGLTLYENYSTTNAAKLLSANDFDNHPNFDAWVDDPIWPAFIYDLGNCWVTAPQDYVSAHMAAASVSPSATLPPLIEVNDLSEPNIVTPGQAAEGQSGHAYIDDVVHGHLDSELLKRLYRWTNRNTVAGKRIAELCKAQGLGKYMDECKPSFVGSSETSIIISDVVASADTYQSSTESGSLLGEYGGRGLKYDKSKTMVYEADRHGFLITMAAIIPEGGYCQAVDSAVREVGKYDFYNPMYDGLGYQASRFSDTVCGTRNWSEHGNPAGEGSPFDETFGFVPMMSSKKVAFNVQNGDFNLRGTRAAYLPYTLDRLLDVGEREIVKSYVTGNRPCIVLRKSLLPDELPTAGLVWRYYYRYQWLSNFNRMFVNGGALQYSSESGRGHDFEMTAREADNFLLHNIVNLQLFAPMLPISESFGTVDDDPDGQVTATTKA